MMESNSSIEPTFKVIDQCVSGSKINLTMINTLIYNAKGSNYRIGATNADGEMYSGWNRLMNTVLTERSFGNNIDTTNSSLSIGGATFIDSEITYNSAGYYNTLEKNVRMTITPTIYEEGEI
jgi:hypothetical protein